MHVNNLERGLRGAYGRPRNIALLEMTLEITLQLENWENWENRKRIGNIQFLYQTVYIM
jgi:hypothetical protein